MIVGMREKKRFKERKVEGLNREQCEDDGGDSKKR